MTPSCSWLRHRPIAHRGLHGGSPAAPENSLEAITRAAASGYAVEIDVQLLSDRQLVVFHDLSLERMTGHARRACDCTANDVRRMRLGGGGHSIPLLADVLETIGGRVPLLIEVKNPSRRNRDPERALAAILAEYAGPVAVQSFNPFSLQWFRRRMPDIPRGQLSSDFKGDRGYAAPVGRHLKLAARHLLICCVSKPTFIAYDARCLPAWAPGRKRRAGLPLLAWTVRSEREMDQALEHCDNVIFEGFRPDPAGRALVTG